MVLTFFCFAYNRLFLSTSLEGKETTEKKSQKRKGEKIKKKKSIEHLE